MSVTEFKADGKFELYCDVKSDELVKMTLLGFYFKVSLNMEPLLPFYYGITRMYVFYC